MLDKINFKNDDLTIDYSFNQKIHINYIGIEPEPDTFYCLKKI